MSRKGKRSPSARAMSGNVEPPVLDEYRTLTVNKEDEESEFCDNSISTSKYTKYSFIPKNLFEQFRRIANFYFLVIAILQAIPQISPLDPLTSILPLVFVLGVTAIKEGFEDYNRHKLDDEINNRDVLIFRSSSFVRKPWLEIQVGDIVRLTNKSEVPADMILLTSSDEFGGCFVETKQLDGETNLKPRSCITETLDMKSENKLTSFNATVKSEMPNKELYTYVGTLEYKGREISVGPDNILLRGCNLRNTSWIFGLVVFTGHDTKLLQNSRAAPSKRSDLERKMNTMLYFIFALQFSICALCAVGAAIWTSLNLDAGYLRYQEDPATTGVLGFLTFLILLNVMVPISLYVSLEVVKVALALFINQDVEMYHEETDTPARARTSNLTEELGQIEYVFSDKTGTLTCNQMEFLMCSIGGIKYGHTADQLEELKGKPKESLTPGYENKVADPEFQFRDTTLVNTMQDASDPNSDLLWNFMYNMALCHSVIPEKENGQITYQASSPDEAALVGSAKNFGVYFKDRVQNRVTLNVFGVEREFEILNVLEFNSDRKRMSIIARMPNGDIKLYSKGADSVMLERLQVGATTVRDATQKHLEEFAKQGLRTLVLCHRDLDEDQYRAWQEKYHTAEVSMTNRERMIELCAEEIERDLELIGATAIEDKLQAGVPRAIYQLAQAGMKIWVLTGDKRETAINIGYSCHLLQQSMNVTQFDVGDEKSFMAQLRKYRDRFVGLDENGDPENLSPNEQAIVITGKCLKFALHEENQEDFLSFARICKAVICCRVSPAQKASVVELVKRHLPKSLTLAIGDGANDVSMIQSAHVGVGISGQEGMQAVMSSDYAIAQFRFLNRLLLIHGRWGYIRVSKLILYSFYKNFTISLTQFWYAWFSGFSGQTLYHSYAIAVYNVFFTGLPIMVLAAFDKDLQADTVMKNPSVYFTGLTYTKFNVAVFAWWILNGLWQSLVIFFFPLAVFEEYVNGVGQAAGLWSMGVVQMTCIVVSVNVKIALETSTWTWLHHLALYASVLSWFIMAVVLDSITDLYAGVAAQTLGQPTLWLVMFLVVVLANLPDYLYKYIITRYVPAEVDILREQESLGMEIKDIDLGEEYDPRRKYLQENRRGNRRGSMASRRNSRRASSFAAGVGGAV